MQQSLNPFAMMFRQQQIQPYLILKVGVTIFSPPRTPIGDIPAFQAPFRGSTRRLSILTRGHFSREQSVDENKKRWDMYYSATASVHFRLRDLTQSRNTRFQVRRDNIIQDSLHQLASKECQDLKKPLKVSC